MPSLLDSLIQQESSGRPGILGVKTPWGRAMGLTQVLPGTGAEMAQKLGIAWRPDLMTAKTDEGAAYQRRIGEAYLQEGLQKTGNVRDALRYYHGGPDRSKWGPKTNAYADEVLARQGTQQPMQMPTRPQDMLNSPVMGQQMPPMEMPSVTSQGSIAGMMQPDISALAQNTPQVKPKAFDKGGKGWVIAGIIADALASGFGGKGGFAPTYLATQQDERENQRRVAEYRERIAAQREERMNQPYRFQNNAGDVVELVPSSGSTRVLYADPQAKPEWTKIENADGSIEMRPMQNASRPTPQHIDALRQHPERAAEFDAKFGRGMAAYILGAR